MPNLNSMGSISSRGFGFGNGKSEILFPFTSFIFTTNIYGKIGPTYPSLLSLYNVATNPWLNNLDYFAMPNYQGIQRFTIPKTGIYRIKTIAPGSIVGNAYLRFYKGAEMQADFSLNKGDFLWILCGQMGMTDASTPGIGGGSGGTFVVKGSANGSFTSLNPLIISGGAGGVGNEANNADVAYSTDASLTTSGNNGNKGYGGTSGAGGQTNYGGSYGGGGGGGYSSNGIVVTSYGNPGICFLFGGLGGTKSYSAEGGFGGGGSGQTNDEPGGGGGYSGGGGGGYQETYYIGSATPRRSGGGGSYISGANQSFTLSTSLIYFGSVKIIAL